MRKKIKSRIKVKIWDSYVRILFGKYVSVISTILSFVVVVYQFPTTWSKGLAIGIFCSFLVILYLSIWIWANEKKSITLKINNTTIVIKEGDIFKEENKKIIPANEFFDTHIGDNIVDPKSLHGIYISNYSKRYPDDLQNDINKALAEKVVFVDQNRTIGNKIQYPLGTIYDDKNGFLLLAYSKYDNCNRAYLNTEDLITCYLSMWNEIDIYRGNDSLSLPVLGGSGLVRGALANYSEKQLIELMLWSFRVSKINLSRTATLNIIIHKSMINKINLLEFKKYSD